VVFIRVCPRRLFLPLSSWLSRVGPIAATAAAATVALATASSATAALGLDFSNPVATPGERLLAYSAIRPGHPAHWNSAPAQTRVYLVPLDLSAAQPLPDGSMHLGPPPPSNRRIIYLGRMRLNDHGVLSIDFRVPSVRPGLYTTAFWCIPCAPPRGSFFASVLSSASWTDRSGPVLRVLAPRK
jgi:hypothetical protein